MRAPARRGRCVPCAPMPEHPRNDGPSPTGDDAAARGERRHVRAGGLAPAHFAARRYVARHRLSPFLSALQGLAMAVFGPAATVVPHLRTSGGVRRLTLVVDAADPMATVDYAAFLPRERAFWTAYAQVPRPDVPMIVAVRPARGWCRVEALAPLFTELRTPDIES